MRRPLAPHRPRRRRRVRGRVPTSAAPGWTYAAPTPRRRRRPAASRLGRPGVAAAGERRHGVGGPVQISAQDVQFEQKAVSAPAGTAFVIHFDNKDAGHAAQRRRSRTRAARTCSRASIVTGPGTADYQVPALAAGTYPFVCDVHPNMTGTLTAG